MSVYSIGVNDICDCPAEILLLSMPSMVISYRGVSDMGSYSKDKRGKATQLDSMHSASIRDRNNDMLHP